MEATPMLALLREARRDALGLDGAEPGSEHDDEVAALLADRVAEARAAWPDLGVDDAAFVRHLGRHLKGVDLVSSLTTVRAADLLLACGCATNDTAALRAFEATFSGELRIVRARLRSSTAEAEDFVQGCQERLFAPPRPKIAEYSGQGDLRNWLRVSLVRMLIDFQRKHQKRGERERVTAPGASLDVPAPSGDLELEFLKRQYGHAFRQAFENAAGTLEPGERILLRQHFSDGLTVDEIGALHGVHRATAARRVAKARARLMSGTRQQLMRELGLGLAELDSVMRMIESNVHVSVKRILGSD